MRIYDFSYHLAMSKGRIKRTKSLGHMANSSYNLIGRTEVILNNLNPDWEKKFDVDYTPGE